MEWLNKVHSEWTSVMMTPECRHKDDLSFLVDIDSVDKDILDSIEIVLSGVNIKERYKTLNGWHYITDPFDLSKISVKFLSAEIHTDGLRLVKVIK
jgi:hypothetical protein